MIRYHHVEPGMFSINRVIFEWSREHWVRQFGFYLKLEDWKILFSFGVIIGTLWISIPHKFLFKNFSDVFYGKKFGERGREIGFMISKKTFQYSLWWYSNINKPNNTWRTGYKFIGRKDK